MLLCLYLYDSFRFNLCCAFIHQGHPGGDTQTRSHQVPTITHTHTQKTSGLNQGQIFLLLRLYVSALSIKFFFRSLNLAQMGSTTWTHSKIQAQVQCVCVCGRKYTFLSILNNFCITGAANSGDGGILWQLLNSRMWFKIELLINVIRRSWISLHWYESVTNTVNSG